MLDVYWNDIKPWRVCFNIDSTLNAGYLHFEMCSLSLTKVSLKITSCLLSFSSNVIRRSRYHWEVGILSLKLCSLKMNPLPCFLKVQILFKMASPLKSFFTSFVFNHVVRYNWVDFNFSSNSYWLIGDSIDALNTYSTICRCNFTSKTAASFSTLILWEAGTISFYLSQHLSCRRFCFFSARDWQLIATKPPFFGSSFFCKLWWYTMN